jgi:hypothetical protein
MRRIFFRSAHSLAEFINTLPPRVKFDADEQSDGSYILTIL